MTLILTLTAGADRVDETDRARAVGDGSLIIGRAGDSDWVLPDSDRQVSKHHCRIEATAEGWLLTDTSTNGTLFGVAREALGRGNALLLQDGDRFAMGPYAIDVMLTDDAAAAPAGGSGDFDPFAAPGAAAGGMRPDPAAAADPFDLGGYDLAGGGQGDGFAADPFDLGRDEAAPSFAFDGGAGSPTDRTAEDSGVLDNHGSVLSEAFPAPGSGIPDDWDPLAPADGAENDPFDGPDPFNTQGAGDSDPFATGDSDPFAAGESDPFAAGESDPFADPAGDPLADDTNPPRAAAGPAAPATAPFSDSGTDPFSNTGTGPFSDTGTDPFSNDGTDPFADTDPFDDWPDDPADDAPGTVAPAAGPSAPPGPRQAAPAPAPAAAAAPGPGAPAGAADGDPMVAFFDALGLDPQDIPPGEEAAIMARAGAVLREAIFGLRSILAERSEDRSRLDVEQTALAGRNNNALKIAGNDADALKLLLLMNSPAFRPAPDAVAEATRDLRIHHKAMVGSMQAAVAAVLKRFDPAALESQMQAAGLLGNILPGHRKARSWEVFCSLYDHIAADANEDFVTLFSEQIAQAYKEALGK